MFQTPSTAASVERFIGGLTIALGLGAMIPRAGFGLYAMLEAEGTRGIWAMSMLTIGVWIICTSYVERMPAFRLLVLGGTIAFWIALGLKFLAAQLWGAALQALVVMLFGLDTWIRLFYADKNDDATKGPAQSEL